jgi:hypothetical protein
MATETYHGHEIAFSAAAGEAGAEERAEEAAPSLQIDGRDYTVVVHSDGTYSAHEYYFDKFGSLQALGRAIARGLPD